ncbi:phosphotransferase [Novosphingobium sp. KCTC 2891]|uniref:phosphotransferase n=1 Tax=Novosphingobium sp. KCTC 2891 TaxID=2989730 RepID=UPI002221C1A9|nr:phosphotransferase [Novosphingobium sp. KCTC 2891]MCW1383615.1 phosphotransferase [Novosphingobium sp. KCTC 2891]
MPQAMDGISKKVLVTINDFLERLTKAENLTSEQLTEVFMAATALRYQIARMDYPQATLDSVATSEMALVEAIGGETVEPPRIRTHAEAWRGQPGERLCAAIEAHDPSGDPAVLRRIRDLLVSYYEPMDPVVGAGTRSTYASGRGDARTDTDDDGMRELTAQGLEDWLHRTGNAPAQARVASFRRLMGGYSKATYIVTLEDGGTETTIVVRKDSPGLPTGSSVASEFPVLGEMRGLGVPVPAPLWVEADASVFDGAFMGVSFVSGTPASHIVPTDPAIRRKWARSTAEVLGQLHASTAIPGGDVRVPVAQEIDDIEARMLARERAPHPGLVVGIGWLRANLNRLQGRPACRIHGDVGYHNMLMRDDAILAMLDWEFSRIGDPVEDLASIKPFMDQIEAWDEFYETYRGICGFTLDPVADSYFNVWREARNMVACLGSLNSLLLPGVKDVPLTVAGTIYIPKYEIAIFDAIEEARKTHV